MPGRSTEKIGEEVLEATTSPSVNLQVPPYLQEKFEAAVQAADSELRDDTNFPLVKGVNAFHHHFEQVWR